MIKKGLAASSFLLLVGCHDRYPLKIDYKQAVGKVIDKGICNEAGSSAWLISFDETLSQNLYGMPVIHNGKRINYVVKAYNIDLSGHYSDSTSQYIFEYYIGDKTYSFCTRDIPNIYELPVIEIQSINRLTR